MNRHFQTPTLSRIRSLSIDSPSFNSLSQTRSLLVFYGRAFKNILECIRNLRPSLQPLFDKLQDSAHHEDSTLKEFLTFVSEAETNPKGLILRMTELKEVLTNLLKCDENLEVGCRVVLRKFSCIFSLCKINEAELKSIRPYQRAQSHFFLDSPNFFKEVREGKAWMEREGNKKRLKDLRKLIERTMFDPLQTSTVFCVICSHPIPADLLNSHVARCEERNSIYKEIKDADGMLLKIYSSAVCLIQSLLIDKYPLLNSFMEKKLLRRTQTRTSDNFIQSINESEKMKVDYTRMNKRLDVLSLNEPHQTILAKAQSELKMRKKARIVEKLKVLARKAFELPLTNTITIDNKVDELDSKFHCLCKQFLDRSLYVMYTNFQNAIAKKKSGILALGKLNQELTKEVYQSKYFFSDACLSFLAADHKADDIFIQISECEEEVPDEGMDPLLELLGTERRLRFRNKFEGDVRKCSTLGVPQKNSSTAAMSFLKRPSNDFWSIPIKEFPASNSLAKRKSNVNI